MKNKMRDFGVNSRVGYNSDKFYERNMYDLTQAQPKEPSVENAIPDANLNRIYRGSSEAMDELPDNSLHLMITSPPYNVGKEYDDNLTLDDYREMLRQVWKETYRVIVDGGRVCINIANVGRKPYLPLHALIIMDMLEI